MKNLKQKNKFKQDFGFKIILSSKILNEVFMGLRIQFFFGKINNFTCERAGEERQKIGLLPRKINIKKRWQTGHVNKVLNCSRNWCAPLEIPKDLTCHPLSRRSLPGQIPTPQRKTQSRIELHFPFDRRKTDQNNKREKKKKNTS